MKYIARISTKSGKLKFTTDIFDTREDAAKSAFARDPKAKLASTSVAVQRGTEWYDMGKDIQWIRRDQVS